MQDQPVMGVQQKPVWDDAHESILDLARRLAGSDAEAVGYPEDMGVDGQRRLPKNRVEHHIRSLPPNAGQGLQLFAVAGRLAAMPFDDRARESNEVLGLGSIKPNGLDPLL